MTVSDRLVGISVSGRGRDGKFKGCLCLCVLLRRYSNDSFSGTSAGVLHD